MDATNLGVIAFVHVVGEFFLIEIVFGSGEEVKAFETDGDVFIHQMLDATACHGSECANVFFTIFTARLVDIVKS